MGMRKRRCPMCRKLKRYAEGANAPASEPKPWRVVGHAKVCPSCADKIENRSKFYKAYRDGLLKGGVSETEANDAVSAMMTEDNILDSRRCPRCLVPVRREKDPWQGGLSNRPGVWFKYHCKSCGYLTTRKEIGDD